MPDSTLADVARLAGVSPITASRALRDSDQVVKKTKNKVLAAAAALNYAPNSAARTLATGTSTIIAVLIPSVTNSVFADVLSGAFSVADESGLTLQLVNTSYSVEKEEDLLRIVLRQKPRSIILSGIDQTPESRRMLEAAHIPIVQIMDLTDDPIDVIVGFSHAAAAAAAAAHLLEMGYENPAALASQLDLRTMRRMQGFRDGLIAQGHPDPGRTVLSPEPSCLPVGARLLREVLERYPDTDAIFCNNDDLAMGSLFEAQRLGVSVPRQLGICGFNNLEGVSATEPGITSVKTNRFDMGRLAVLRAILPPNQTAHPHRIIDLGFEVVPRGSTKRR